MSKELISETPALIHAPVVALGYQAADGTIVVTNVLCMNFPAITKDQMVELSWKLFQWSSSKHDK